MVAARLRAAGHAVEFAPATAAPTGTAAPGRVLQWHGFGYLDPQRSAVGVAVAAAADDPTAREAAAAAVLRWQRATRTRRFLLPQPAPAVPQQRTGGPGGTWTADVHAYLRRGDTVLLLGGTLPSSDGRVLLVDTLPRASALRDVDPDRLAFVIPPDVDVEYAVRVLALLRERFPALRGQHPDSWSYAAFDRALALRSVVEAADETWILADTDTTDASDELMAAAMLADSPSRLLRHPTDIEPHWLGPGVRTIALLSTRPAGEQHILTLLSGLGPLSVVRRHVHSEVVPFDDPWSAESDDS